MTSIVHAEYPSNPLEVQQSMTAGVARLRQGFDSTRGLSAMLLAAMVAVFVLFADTLVDRWVDGHLLTGWLALWGAGFVALTLGAAPAKNLAVRLVARLDAWSQRVARRRAETRLWEMASQDPRVMAELQAARTRSQA